MNEKLVTDCEDCPFGFADRMNKPWCAYHQKNAQSLEHAKAKKELPPVWCPLKGKGTIIKLKVKPITEMRKR